ncbi:velvet factor-domain-containing protein [Biscogniauxia mediterranea]|nr:velvet factor-domain-containing protein [Biscogniauxia mediterranea]
MAYHHQGNHWPHAPGYLSAMNQAMPNLQGAPQVQPPPPHQSQPHTNGPHSQRSHRPETYRLTVLQQPIMAKAANGKDKDRKPVDPPPILQLDVPSDEDPDGVYRQSPYLIAVAYLEYGRGSNHGSDAVPPANLMSGTMVSSLHRLKDPSNQEGAFFIFGDLTIKSEGTYTIRFDLLQMEFSDEPGALVTITSVKSDPFRVYAGKSFPGMAESTFLTRSFSDQGVRLRLRKDSRQLANRKRNLRAAEVMEDKKTSAPRNSRNGQITHMEGRYYDPNSYTEEPNAKRRQQQDPGQIGAGSTTTSEGSTQEMRPWGTYESSTGQSFGTQGAIGTVTTGPSTSTSMGAPLMPPPTSGRIDTHFSSLPQGPMYASPAGERQSPIGHSSIHHSPIQFGHPGAQSSSPHMYVFGSQNTTNPNIGLPHSAVNTPIQNVSPRSQGQINGTTPTGTASPVNANMYTTAPPTSSTPQPHHQSPYPNPAPYQSMQNTFDHGSLRQDGIPASLTGNEGMNGHGFPDVFHMVPKPDQSA